MIYIRTADFHTADQTVFNQEGVPHDGIEKNIAVEIADDLVDFSDHPPSGVARKSLRLDVRIDQIAFKRVQYPRILRSRIRVDLVSQLR